MDFGITQVIYGKFIRDFIRVEKHNVNKSNTLPWVEEY